MNARAWRLGVATLVVVAGLAFGLGRCSVFESGAADTHSHSDAPSEPSGVVWTCSMHPAIRESASGSCPICGMDLIPVTSADSHSDAAPDRVSLGPRARVLAKIRTARVRRAGASGTTLRLLGRVDYDETSLQAITSWVAGRIDTLHIEATGQRIRRGQVVATLYSPEAYSAQQDLLAARRALARLESGSELARSAAQAGLAAARERLILLGIPEDSIDQVESAGRAERHIAVHSPFAGTVIERLVTEGDYVGVGAPLYRIADLNRLWVQLDAYESDLARLAVGQVVQIAVEALPGELLEGRIAFLDPSVDSERRTVRVRVEVRNPGQRLRPGMFARAEVRAEDASSTEPLVIPASAPLFTGARSVVYVEVPDAESPTYEARTVRLGLRNDSVFPVVAGLQEGERVVVDGAFVLDAELQIRGGQSMMTRPDDHEPGPFDEVFETPRSWESGLRSIVEAYLHVQERLADDDLLGAREGLTDLASALDRFHPSEPVAAARAYHEVALALRSDTAQARRAGALEVVRAHFEALSQQLALLLRRFGNPTSNELRVARCPMAFDNRGAEWIQTSERVDNAYFGHSMRHCGSITATIAPSAHLTETASDAEPRGEP